MKSAVHVGAPPRKPLVVFDGDCNFCSRWIRRWQAITGEAVDYLPFQDPRIAGEFPEIPRAQFETAVQLIQPDGTVYSAAEAAVRTLAYNPREHWLLDWYEHSPWFARVSEAAYRFVAGHRRLFSFLTRLGWGAHVEPPTHVQVRRLFLRALALIYLVAFGSLWVQLSGLIGSQGILPAQSNMAALSQETVAAQMGAERYHIFPTFCWWNTTDRFLHSQCAAGVALSLLLLAGIAPAPCLFLLWLIYLSLTTVSREFLAFQWDILLLETGFLSIFFAPLQLLPGKSRAAPPSKLVLFLLRWLLFRLMFESGCVKLLSHDPTWHNLTALAWHFETQPLPTWIGWWAHQLPLWTLKAVCAVMFGVELVIPLLVFGPRRLRQVACVAFVALQLGIFLTGNYGFFNLLSVALAILLLDDAALKQLVSLGRRLVPAIPGPQPPVEELHPSNLPAHPENVVPQTRAGARLRWPRQVTVPLACITLGASLMQLFGMLRVPIPWPRPFLLVYQWLAPLRSFNSYGLFAVMTTSRPEIIIEGSDDARTWLAYEFKYKPGRLDRRPRFVEPHMPRLDWQMWFAALGQYQQNPWLIAFCVRLLQASPPALALLERNPFPKAAPKYIRASVYEYHFTTLAERRKTGAWWRRERKGDYCPVLSLRETPRPPPLGPH